MKKEGFVKGAVLGGLIGSAAGLLLAPKSGKDLRCDISETCSNITDKGYALRDSLVDEGHHIKDRVRGTAEDLHDVFFEDGHDDSNDFVIGSVIGALVGATAAVLLAPKSGKELRRNLEKTYEKVKDNAEEIREEMVDYAHKGQKAANSSIDDFLELAHVGLKAWNNLKRGR